ncbi:putative transcriptional regulatory protein TcrX [Streptomyces rubrolavendulae]|uniref:Putative transcriptional regulatory protein TcrX n=1 Tax=Streptomyces rubrolavendulae TaxID=285473 RepID=A0A1D8G3D8_9ACTN|nr:putative transcriptional regulatory protein TcrX [Streptomyces rubrolavendulae]
MTLSTPRPRALTSRASTSGVRSGTLVRSGARVSHPGRAGSDTRAGSGDGPVLPVVHPRPDPAARPTVRPRSRAQAVLVVGDLVLDEGSREVTRAGEAVRLTATEFALLRYLMRHPGRVLSKARILDRVWAYDFGGRDNVVEQYISYLRRKIDVGRPPLIHTRRGAGYLIKPPA